MAVYLNVMHVHMFFAKIAKWPKKGTEKIFKKHLWELLS